MNEGATHVLCATLPDARTAGALMPFDEALLRLRASSVGVAFSTRCHKRQINAILGNLLRLHYPRVVVMGAARSVP
jgi:hypothetical protein